MLVRITEREDNRSALEQIRTRAEIKNHPVLPEQQRVLGIAVTAFFDVPNVLHHCDMPHEENHDPVTREPFCMSPSGDREAFNMEVFCTPQNTSVDDQLLVEYDILEQIVDGWTTHGGSKQVYLRNLEIKYLKCYSHSMNVDDHTVQDEIENFWTLPGFGFIQRTNSSYHFRPDDRDILEQAISEQTGTGIEAKTSEQAMDDINERLAKNSRWNSKLELVKDDFE